MGEDLNDWARRKTDKEIRVAIDALPIFKETKNQDKEAIPQGVSLTDFYAYMPMHLYIFVPSRELWPAASVNARVPKVLNGRKKIYPSVWLDKHRPADQMTWAPGYALTIENSLISQGGWISREGSRVFNLYRPPQSGGGDASQAGPWIEHVQRIYPDDAHHIFRFLAHRVQKPAEKINHALVLGGAQGIGKDALLEPTKHAVGPWNFAEVSPTHMLGRFNGFVKSVVLRVSEARDLGDQDRYAFYDHMKVYTAAPPDVLRCDEKHIREHAVLNVCGVIITTNHKTNGIYLPADDRRHYVAWSDETKEKFDEGYWNWLWGWYDSGGCAHVAAYLRGWDLSNFNAKAPPPTTTAFWDIVDASRAPEDAELADTLDAMDNPDALVLSSLAGHASGGFRDWLEDRRNRRQIPHRMETAEYLPVRNPAAKDGLWKVSGRRQAAYARSTLSLRDRIAAVQKIVEVDR